MKTSAMLSALLLGASSLALGTGALAATITDPITGVVHGTTKVVAGVVNGTLSIFKIGAKSTEYVVSNVKVGQELTDLRTGTKYVVTSILTKPLTGVINGTQFVITNSTTGAKYLVTGVSEGVMDVINGDNSVRYDYMNFKVKAL